MLSKADTDDVLGVCSR